MKLHDIPRYRVVSRTDFAAYMAAPETPLLVTGAMKDWPAMKAWTPEFFAEHFPRFPVVCNAPQFPPTARCTVKTNLASYVKYLRDPQSGNIEGEWRKGNRELLLESGLTLYSGDFNPAHRKYGNPELVFQYLPELPDFVDSWMPLLDARFREVCLELQSHHFVYLSAAGGMTPLHHDFWGTHALLAQISGRKEAFMFSPKMHNRLYRERTGEVRRMLNDPQFDDVEGWRGDLLPGDILIIPSGWMHYVETHELSITYSVDWIDANNWREYLRSAIPSVRSKRRGYYT